MSEDIFENNKNVIEKFDDNGNLVYSKDNENTERWLEYDDNGRIIYLKKVGCYSKPSNGVEFWYEYDSNGRLISSKSSWGVFELWEYDSNGNEIHHKLTSKNSLYPTDDPLIIRTSIEEEWKEYDSENRLIKYRDHLGNVQEYIFEDNDIIEKVA